MNKYICAIDLSGPYASFALSVDKKILFAESFLLQNRKNALFFDKFFLSIAEHDLNVNDISKWIIGTGPGSFTGLRISAAFVSGIVYNSDVETSGIPSAFPIASKIGLKKNENIAVLFYATKGTLAIYSITNKNGSFVKAEHQIEVCSNNLDILAKYNKIAFIQSKNIKNFLVENNQDMDKIIILDYFPVTELLTNEWIVETGINDLLYVRPPTVVCPKV